MASPDSTGGRGIHFEARVVAYYLAAVFAEAPARAVPGLHVTQVLTQRAAFGEPLDDVIVNGIMEDGRFTKLSLQVKSTLTFTENDPEWVEVLGQAWATFTTGIFDPARDRLGVAISSYNARADKHYQSVLSWADHSPSGKDFAKRITRKDFSHKDQRAFMEAARNILSNHAETTIDDDTLWKFLCAFRILHFDFDTQDASRDAASALERIRHCLPPEQRSQATTIWTHLVAEAGKITPTGGGASRASLASGLQHAGLPSGTGTTFWRDLQAIDQESKRALASIKGDIHGLRLNRTQAYEQIQDALRSARFVQIDGEPGSGKSALLKQLAEEAARSGPVFVLKDSRIQPRGWAAHAGQLRLSGNLIGLMSELGTVTEPLLFIDGIDKVIDQATQLTVNDLIRSIASEPALSSWKVLVTVREQNLDHIATWLDPEALRRLCVRSVTISPLNSDELIIVSAEFPRLRPLLLEAGNADVILRRPFFLEAILNLSGREGTTSLPATEAELLRLWWELGGTDQSASTPAQHRRNVLLCLAERFIASSASAISVRNLPPEPLEDLKSAGVIRDKNLGHSITFSHDIYEEWILCEWLIGKLPNIASVLKDNSELQAFIRPVRLLGSYELETNSTKAEWQRLYEELADASLRPVWQRAVLASCLHTTRATEILGKLLDFLHQDNNAGLKKLLNALQTLEVVPNMVFFDETILPELESEERVSLAQSEALPKVFTWVRFLDWYLPHDGEPSPSLIPDLLPVFSTWQSACAGRNIRHCRRIGEIAHGWLDEFEAALHPERYRKHRDPFGLKFAYEEEHQIEEGIRRLFLSSAADVPELVSAYLDAKARGRLRHMYRKQIVSGSAAIARWLPKHLVDYIIATFLEHPKDSQKSENYFNLASRDLGIEGNCFYPASPYQPPFLVLLRLHEAEGLRLVKAICNHSIDVWRWVHQCRDFRQGGGTPIPIEIELPWGKQFFWGDCQVYLWFRGFWGNNASRCALMALELWAFERINAGDDFAEVFRKVLEGSDSVAALGLAVSLCIAQWEKSIEQTLPLITCPQIWQWDLARVVQDRSALPANEIGDWNRYRLLMKTVRELNQRPHRQTCIRDMVPLFVFSHDVSLKERYMVGIRSFTEKLPFEYVEEKADEVYDANLRKTMSSFVEQADPQFWHCESTEDGKHIKIWNDPPSAKSHERLQQLENHTQLNRCLRLELWAQKSLEGDKLEDGVILAEALAEARDLDSENLFDEVKESFEEDKRRAAVAGVAYALARFADDILWDDITAAWTFEALMRAETFRGFNELTFRDTILSGHPLTFAVYGLAALMARGYEIKECQSALLTFAVAPLVSVVESTVISAKLYAVMRPAFYWVLFGLVVRQCIIARDALPDYYKPYWDEAEAARNLALLNEAEVAIKKGLVPSLPPIPLPWVKGKDRNAEENDFEVHGFQRNPLYFQWHIAERTILRADLDILLAAPERRSQLVTLIEQLLMMTIQEIVPPFAKTRRGYRGNTPFEWVFSFFRWLGKVASRLSSTEIERTILQRLFATDNETALLAMQNFAPSYLVHALLSPAVISDEAFSIWERISKWIIENPEGRIWGQSVDREFSHCVFILLFCLSGDFQPLVCVVEQGWSPLERFQPIIEKVVQKFGTNSHLYLGLLRFLKKGGLDLTPEPGLSWLCEIAVKMKQDQEFWRINGGETVEILRLILDRKAQVLSAPHRDVISLITDILVDNGVRGAGFLQQDQLRQ